MQRMFAHSHPLFFSQLCGLAQNEVGHANLSDVMQKRTKLQRLHLFRMQAILAAQTQTVGNYAFRMSMSLGVSGLQSCREAFNVER